MDAELTFAPVLYVLTAMRPGGAESSPWKSKSLAVWSEEDEMKCVPQAESWMSLTGLTWSSSTMPTILPVSTSHLRIVQSSEQVSTCWLVLDQSVRMMLPVCLCPPPSPVAIVVSTSPVWSAMSDATL